jgi:hypothetical protein
MGELDQEKERRRRGGEECVFRCVTFRLKQKLFIIETPNSPSPPLPFSSSLLKAWHKHFQKIP